MQHALCRLLTRASVSVPNARAGVISAWQMLPRRPTRMSSVPPPLEVAISAPPCATGRVSEFLADAIF